MAGMMVSTTPPEEDSICGSKTQRQRPCTKSTRRYTVTTSRYNSMVLLQKNVDLLMYYGLTRRLLRHGLTRRLLRHHSLDTKDGR